MFAGGGQNLRIVFGFSLVFCAAALTACVEPAPPAATRDCTVSYVVDGDTVHLNCGGATLKARLVGYDTPEVFSPQCAAEKAAGDAATGVLQSLVAADPVTAAVFQGQDRYGRALVRLEIGGQDVAQVMIGTGLARSYAGRQRPDWCAILR